MDFDSERANSSKRSHHLEKKNAGAIGLRKGERIPKDLLRTRLCHGRWPESRCKGNRLIEGKTAGGKCVRMA